MKGKIAILTVLVAVAGLIGVALFNQSPVNSVKAGEEDSVTIDEQTFSCGNQDNVVFTGTATYDTSSQYIRWVGVFLNDNLVFSSDQEPANWSTDPIDLVPGEYLVFAGLYDPGSREFVAEDEWEFGIEVCVEPSPTPTEIPTPTPTPTPEVTPTPTEEPTPQEPSGSPSNPPTFAGSSTLPPQCEQTGITNEAANVHVYRKGSDAVVKWIPTGGDQAHIYYKQVSSPDWQYSVTVANTGYAEIHDLGTLDISFAVQQVNGCSGGVSVVGKTIVDGNTSGWVLFR